MEKIYLIALKISSNGGPYLQLTQDSPPSIHAFKTIDEAKSQFSGFYDKVGYPNNYETHTSAGMGIVFLSPHVLEVPTDPLFIAPYILDDMRPYEVKGIGFGYHVNMMAIKVTDAIFELSVLDVAHDVIWRPQPDHREMYSE